MMTSRKLFAAGLFVWVAGCQSPPATHPDAGVSSAGDDAANAVDVGGAADVSQDPDVANAADVASAADVANAADVVNSPDAADDQLAADVSTGGSDGGPLTCGGDEFEHPRRPVDILVVLDRSASMSDDAAGLTPTGPTDPSKWDQIVPALTDVIRQTGDSFNWGLKTFPEEGLACSATSLTGKIDVPVAPMNKDAMIAAIQALTPTGAGTPIGGAIRVATDSLLASKDGNPTFLLLVTDGGASCTGKAGNLVADTESFANPDTQAAITSAVNTGYRTFVLAPNTSRPTDMAALNSFAVAGQEAVPATRPGLPRYYVAGAQGELVTALEQAALDTATCELRLSHAPPVPEDVTVIVDGAVVPRDPAHLEGWDLGGIANGFLDLYGSWCQSVKAGSVSDVRVTFGCPAGGADSGADGMCPARSYGLSTLPPSIMIVLDRSASMDADVDGQPCTGGCGASSKWAQTVAAINETVQRTQSAIQWSLELFPDSTPGNTCGVNPSLAVPPGFGQAAPIATALASTQPGGSSPTTWALAMANNHFNSTLDPNPRYVLLATDGLPTCGGLNIPSVPDSAGAVAMVSTLAGNRIPTFVVGVGTAPAARDTLTQMALAGQRARSGGTAYYAPSDTASLVSALSTIAGSVVSCSFTVPGDPADPAHITVSTGFNDIIPRDPIDGWTYSAVDQSIVLTGSWCDRMRAGSLVFVTVDIGC
jgi:Mg-chelatase subunit ChlD